MSEHSKEPKPSVHSKKPSVKTGSDGGKGKPVKEYGGRKDGLDPTRYGDWEKNGRCIDF